MEKLTAEHLREIEEAKQQPGSQKVDKIISSSEKFFGKSTIFGRDGEHNTPYMTRRWIGRLRLHIFYRGDQDPDCHDHPWDFWTFPFHSYVEQVAVNDGYLGGQNPVEIKHQIVPAWRWSFRPATHCHRVLGRVSAGGVTNTHWGVPGTIVTLVWRSETKRKWGFLKNRAGQWCWTPWKDYIFGGGKDAPCSPG